jgi:hypothetical protein
MFCSILSLQKETGTGDKLKPLPCRSWHCEHCWPKRKRQLIAMALAGCPNKMLTLTVNPAVGNSPDHRRVLLHKAWVVLRKRMARKLRVKNVPYMAFVEKTEAGEPHLHILLRCNYIPFKWYSANMRKLLRAPHVWINKISTATRAAYYVTKYCAKAPAQFGKLKRYWQSANYTTRKDKENIKKVFTREHDFKLFERYSEIVDRRLKAGWALKPLKDGWVDFIRPSKMTPRDGYVYYSYATSELRIARSTRL